MTEPAPVVERVAAPPLSARSTTSLFAAVDIGASSGRVIVGELSTAARLHVVHRFPNGVVERAGSLHWDFEALFEQVLVGLAAAAEFAAARGQGIAGIGIDTWAVDYGLVDADGGLAAAPFSYRDGRGAAQVPRVHGLVGEQRLYETSGLQHLPFNTVFQLAAEDPGVWAAHQALLIPDLLAFKLTGIRRTESTNASTTGVYDAVAGEWATEILSVLDLPAEVFPQLIEPGETVGTLLPEVATRTGLPAATPVVAVGSHDTASAVAAVPATGPNFAYVSSGTWSLVGVELDSPVLSEASRAANFTNERGVDGTIRYLRNVGGLWLLSESLRTWESELAGSQLEPPLHLTYDAAPAPAFTAADLELPRLLAAAAAEPAGGALIDVDAEEFIAPGDMPRRIRAAVHARGEALEARPPAVVRCIMDSLAAAYARTVAQAQELAGCTLEVLHIVGGGSQNELLCQLTADATGLPVIAGPVEATALGNVLVQARAAGVVSGSLQDLRRVVAASFPARTYIPR